jgi:uroporphyrinogen-III synthase
MSLEGKKIIITRPRHQSESLIKKLEAKGAIPIVFPTIEIQMASDTRDLDQAIQHIQDYDWVVITSANGVNFFIQRMEELGIDPSILNQKKVATVGTITQENLAVKNIQVDFVPEQFVADVLGETLPQSDIARKKLIAQLEERGAKVNSIKAYETTLRSVSKEDLEDVLAQEPDWVCFTSASTSKGMEKAFQDHKLDIPNIPCAVIGPVTERAAKARGFHVAVCAEPHTVDGMIEGMFIFE